MRILALSLASAGLLALTACGGGSEANNTSANTLGTETLPPLDSGTDLNTGAGTELNTSSNTSLDVGTNGSANISTTNTTATNTVGNSQ
jgi:hypothetical protein